MMAKTKTTLPREVDRTKVPIGVQHQLMMEAGYKCGNPRCQNIITLHMHHIQYVSEGGGNDPSNLLVLCPYCHSMHHAGHIPVEAVRVWKGLLLALNQAFDRRGMELLLFLHKHQRSETWYTADGVLQFASLMAAGLVQMNGQVCAAPWNVPESRHRVILTDRGIALVEAWLAGDEQKYRELISSGPAAAGQAESSNPSESPSG